MARRASPLTSHHKNSVSGARGFDPNPPKEPVKNARATVMNGTNRVASRADAALSDDLLNLIANDYPLNLFDNPLPILKAQPDPFWAGHPVRS